MLLSDKYNPRRTGDFIVHREKQKLLDVIAQDHSIPHMIIYGPRGSGKNTLVEYFLEKIFGKEVNNMKINTYKVLSSSNKTEDVAIKQSKYHIIIEPNNNNHDKYIIQDIIKTYATNNTIGFFTPTRKFKVVFIDNIDFLSYNAQASLRRTMEIYAHSCRFIMICTSLSKIIDPLKSRCFCFRVENPCKTQIYKLVLSISCMEKMDLIHEEIVELVNKSDRSLRETYWQLELRKAKCRDLLSIDLLVQEIVLDIFLVIEEKEEIISILTKNREKIYNLLVSNITISEIIVLLMNEILRILKKEGLSEQYVYETVLLASAFEYNGVYGRKEINHLEGFYIGIISSFYKIKNENK